MTKSVYVAYTGGTIGMARTPDGYRPEEGQLEALMRDLRQLSSPEVPTFEIHEYEPLLDSSNMTPADWDTIAKDIAANFSKHDGFMVLHGTDTMGYTAAALSFMLEGLTKPVIVTGSQIPLCEARNDARENLITSLIIAGTQDIPEVCLYFNGRLLRGNRATKVNAAGFDAFDSPNCPPLGTVGISIDIDRDLLLKPIRIPLRVQTCSKASVAALRLFPGIPATVVDNILQPPLQGLVLECYGAGNAPDRDQGLLDTLSRATDRGVVIVDITQCLRGTVNLGAYAAGSALAKCGVIGGFDMTVEAALTKLLYLFSLNISSEDVKREMQRDLRGEFTPPQIRY